MDDHRLLLEGVSGELENAGQHGPGGKEKHLDVLHHGGLEMHRTRPWSLL